MTQPRCRGTGDGFGRMQPVLFGVTLQLMPASGPPTDFAAPGFFVEQLFAHQAVEIVEAALTAFAAERISRIVGLDLERGPASRVAAAVTYLWRKGGLRIIEHGYDPLFAWQ